MPVDFQQIQAKVQQIAERERARLTLLGQRKDAAIHLLNDQQHNLTALRDKVKTASETDSRIRCASPTNEFLMFSGPCPASLPEATLIAVDGSQINPDRHAALQFAVVNAGAVVMRPGSGQAPDLCTNSKLLYGEELENKSGDLMSEQLIALQRDLMEREMMIELA
ncbi:MAG TPA: hypothetical protein VMJ64_04090, partial [Anaerolineales bacterium]|nr:hypothetical protein [Anaerolineales bacterium]